MFNSDEMDPGFDYRESLDDEPMPEDDAVGDSKARLGSPPGSWKQEPPTEQDELPTDEGYRDPDPED